jgi:hypothetical protein
LLVLPKSSKDNTDYFTKTVVLDLQTNICNTGRRKMLKGSLLDLDNAPAHDYRGSVEVIEKTLAHRAPHPAYSSDLAISNFFLFGILKELFKGNTGSDRNEFLSLITEFSNGIYEETWPNVFRNWIKRLR